MAIDQGIVLAALTHHIEVVKQEIIDILDSKRYTTASGRNLQIYTFRINLLLQTRNRLTSTGNPLTKSNFDLTIKPLLQESLEAYKGTHEAEKIGTNKNTIKSTIDAQIAEFT